MTLLHRKFIFSVISLVIVIVFLLGIVLWSQASFDKNLKVIFLDIGQGDSILINTPQGKNILIDGGPDNTVIQKLGKYLPFYDKDIDIMILTHPHDDHVVGLVEVLRRYKVKEIYYTGVIHTSPSYLNWLEEIKKEGATLNLVDHPFNLDLEEDLTFKFLFPTESFLDKRVDNLNNTSIINQLVYKNKTFLFTGDAEIELEEELINGDLDLESNILKVCHHGSKTSSSREFLEAVQPEIVIISVGQNNKFGHPSYRTIKNLQKIGAQIYRTDRDGDVVIKSDGENIVISNQ